MSDRPPQAIGEHVSSTPTDVSFYFSLVARLPSNLANELRKFTSFCLSQPFPDLSFQSERPWKLPGPSRLQGLEGETVAPFPRRCTLHPEASSSAAPTEVMTALSACSGPALHSESTGHLI